MYCRLQPNALSEQRATLSFLEQQARTLATAADRLDGAGFWAAARAVWSSHEKVEGLSLAIADHEASDGGAARRR